MSIDRSNVRQHLDRLLAEEAQLLAELKTVLEQETDIVRGDDTDAIQRIGSNRHRCVDRLSRIGTERLDTGRMLSFGTDRTGMEKLLDWVDPTATLRIKWTANLELARRCKALNDRNGAIVAAKLDRVQQLLGKLRGATAPSVYSPKGSRYGSLGPRELGRA
jgi:flagellar biosynthesis/type III secretory pathway chaperone